MEDLHTGTTLSSMIWTTAPDASEIAMNGRKIGNIGVMLNWTRGGDNGTAFGPTSACSTISATFKIRARANENSACFADA